MNNFTAEQILKINEIFSRIVDCKGNLKVFKDFDWDARKGDVIAYRGSKGISLSKVNNATVSKLEDYYDYDGSKANILDICKDITDYQDLGIKFDIDGSGNKFRDENINKHFNVLLDKYKNGGTSNDFLEKNDFNILYGGFYELLMVCNFTLDKEGYTIFYLNIFQKLIEYFRDGKNSFYVYTQSGIKNLDSKYELRLDVCFKIHQILCLLLSRINWSIDGSGESLSDDELREILGDLFGIFADFRKAILKAIDIVIKNKILGELTKGAKNIIYYGAPGTGKTKFVKDRLDILDPNRARTEWVQFHSGFEYEDFIDGIKPVGIQNGNLNLALTNGIFKEFCLKAAQNDKENFFFIVDEINRADIAAVFGETLSLLEENYQGENIKTKNFPLSNQEFFIPANIYFIGMMNDVDKSIDCFDLALRRRFTWVLMECDYGVIENATDKTYRTKCENLNNYITNDLKYLVEYKDETRVKIKSIRSYYNMKKMDEYYDQLFQKTTDEEKENNKKRYERTSGLNLGRAYEIGHSYFLKNAKMSEQEIWDRHIEPILREYIRTQFSDGEVEKKLETAKKIFVG
ncbi:ATPase family associated with various cellular activities (AAA) [Campylobacter rectus RM3267]|uniref:McrBC 5-methylcytosine restriction system, component McrB n=2 Tax=Campylobacter rectus TaxID=203 RepID=A0A6G5QNU2_CAMRE|nr:AAA family ATPase [Campylobacter rectus]EEF12617.1 ATPase family associated with various cellular activities (AAA) [Campylobacter rectus RM3267]QCD47267.1 McrBC 5-methylcytosine restriction system, component McrB [Campylobacter rectus]UEB47961.1 AAA family ATPase [Campylobacter rectus]